MNLEDFIEQLNDCFGPPFIDEGIVVARAASGGGVAIKIGNRDIQFDENLKFVGRGTALYDPRVVVSGISSIETECPDCSRTSMHKEFSAP